MTREEAIKEIEKAFEPAFANYIITALTEGATVSDLEQNPTTKNDLEVDWESYKDVDGNSLDDLILEVLQNNFDCGNTYGYKVADEIIGLLPSVTPQEPILDKIRERVERLQKACGKDDLNWQAQYSAFSMVLDIIDEYKAESEVEDGNDD